MMNGKRHQKLKLIPVNTKLRRLTYLILKVIVVIFLGTIMLSEQKYKEPTYKVLEKKGSIEIRDYDSCIVAKTSIQVEDKESDSNMFRVLASYIFGGNANNQSIPMTAPVTTFNDDKSYTMMFYMLEAANIDDLPKANNRNIKFEVLDLGKCGSISFSWFVNDQKINRYRDKLLAFLDQEGYTYNSSVIVNRYDSPWKLPFMRRNEILVQIQ